LGEPLAHDVFPRVIETARLRLRQPRPDENVLCGQLLAEAEAVSNREPPLSQQQADSFGFFMVEHWQRYGFGFLLIEPHGASAAIGHCGFKYVDAFPGHWPQILGAIELGYALVPAARGYGYATEASKGVLAAAFSAFPIASIQGRCNPTNLASAAVLLSCGMTELETGTQRRFVLARRGYASSHFAKEISDQDAGSTH